MNKKVYRHMIPLQTSLPTIDLHGENVESASFLVKDFLNDQIRLGNGKAVIIHGIGTGILKKTVHSILGKDKRVEKYYVDFFNVGCTIVELKK